MNASIYRLVRGYAQAASGVAVRSAGEEVGRAELLARVDGLADRLEALGVEGERCGVLLPNVTAFPVTVYALARAGASAVLLNPLSAAREIAEQVEDAGAALVVTNGELQGKVPPGTPRLIVDEASGAILQTIEEPQGSAGSGVARGRSSDEAVVIFTAGAAGRLRGAALSHQNLIANAAATVEAMALVPEDRVVGVLPFAHAFGLTACMNAAMMAGATLLPFRRFSPTAVLDALQAGGATVLAGVPSMFHALVAVAERKRLGRTSLRVTLCGGAPMIRELARRWEEHFGIPLRQGYGLTEAAPVCLFNRVEYPNEIGSLGRPLRQVQVSVRDAAGEPLTAGEVGELWVRGPNVFGGYIDDPTPAGTLQDGWLRTGDLASEQGGAVTFRGTLKPMFTRNGFNVYPEEVRRALCADPRIADAQVFARPDPVREYEIVLEVTPRSPTALTADQVREVCKERLAMYKQPSEIRVNER